MADFLDETVRQLQARVKELAPVIDEHERLRAALAALESLNDDTAPARPRRARDAPKAQTQPAQRRPRGANREAILTVVGERAGLAAAEIAQATGIEKNVSTARSASSFGAGRWRRLSFRLDARVTASLPRRPRLNRASRRLRPNRLSDNKSPTRRDARQPQRYRPRPGH